MLFNGTVITSTQVTAAGSQIPTQTANNVDTTLMISNIGNKGDTAVATVGVLSSIMAYVKGLFTKIVVSITNATVTGMIVEKDTSGLGSYLTVTSGVGGAFGAWTQHIASTAADYWLTGFSFSPTSDTSAGIMHAVIEIGKGAAGAEVAVMRHSFTIKGLAAIEVVPYNIVIPIPIKISAGTRIAIHSGVGGGVAIICDVTPHFYQSLEV